MMNMEKKRCSVYKSELNFNERTSPTSFKETLKSLADSSSLHGIPKIVSSRQIAVKVMWCLLFVGTFTVLTIQLYNLFRTYYSYPIKTTVSLQYSPLVFPAVSVCNMNPVKTSKLSMSETVKMVLTTANSEVKGAGRRRRDTLDIKPQFKEIKPRNEESIESTTSYDEIKEHFIRPLLEKRNYLHKLVNEKNKTGEGNDPNRAAFSLAMSKTFHSVKQSVRRRRKAVEKSSNTAQTTSDKETSTAKEHSAGTSKTKEETTARTSSEKEENSAGTGSDKEEYSAKTKSDKEETSAGTGSDKEENSAGTRSDKEETSAGTGSDKEENSAGTESDKEEHSAGTGSDKEKNSAGTGSDKEENSAGTGSDKEENSVGTGSDKEENSVGTGSDKEENSAGTGSDKEENSAGTGSDKEENSVGTGSDKEENSVGTGSDKEENSAGTGSDKEENSAGTGSDKEENSAGTKLDKEDSSGTDTWTEWYNYLLKEKEKDTSDKKENEYNWTSGEKADGQWTNWHDSKNYVLSQLFSKKDEWEERADEFRTVFKKENITFRRQMGHQKEDMILSASFAGTLVNSTYFNDFFSSEYGNCFTMSSPNYVAWRSGPSHGIKLTLNLEIDEYVPNFSTGFGIKLLLHERGTYPLPSNEGITLNPGTETSIGLKMVRLSRLGEPHGDCVDGKEFAKRYKKKYSKAVCYHFCRVVNAMEACKCVPVDAPDDISLTAAELPVCNITNTDVKLCLLGEEVNFNNGEYECDCKEPCKETVHATTMSSRFWPTDDYLVVLIDEMCTENYTATSTVCTEKGTPSFDQQKYRTNFLRVFIYYEDLIFESITEEPMYESVRFLSDIGGAMGLFLGASVLSLVEFLQLLLEIVLFITKKAVRDKNRVESLQ